MYACLRMIVCMHESHLSGASSVYGSWLCGVYVCEYECNSITCVCFHLCCTDAGVVCHLCVCRRMVSMCVNNACTSIAYMGSHCLLQAMACKCMHADACMDRCVHICIQSRQISCHLVA